MAQREQQVSAASRRAAREAERPKAPVQLPTGHFQRAVARPWLASAADLVQMQQHFGNRAVQRWLAASGLQASLVVGAAGDGYEREADRAAAQVVDRLPTSPRNEGARGRSSLSQLLKQEEAVRRQPLAPSLSRLATPPAGETDEEVRRLSLKDDDRHLPAPDEAAAGPAPGASNRIGKAGGAVGPATGDTIERARGGGKTLPASVRRPMEQAFGADFRGVRVHTDGRADRLNRSLSARAFTTGRDVFFRQGEFDPATRHGQKLLAHELAHVVQQGRAAPAVRRALSDEAEPRPQPKPEEEGEQPGLRDALTGRRLDRLQPGDVVLPRGGTELAADLAAYGRHLQQLWRGQPRGASAGLPAGGLFLGGGMVARANGRRPERSPLRGDYYVFRCSNRALAEKAAQMAANWSVFENSANGVDTRFSQVKNFDALAQSPRYNRTRAVNLAAFFLRGASVNNLLCADFAVMCFQAAALMEDVQALKGATPAPAPAEPEQARGERKTGLAALPPGVLRIDPRRVREFQFAAELHRLARGDNPAWTLAGLY